MNVLCVVITKLGSHGKTSKGSQRYYCPKYQKTFPAEFGILMIGGW
ncbi:IS1/IS1595 family N-terminal zinc-binding domain-containing protein [Dapis sp. BLCC M229]